MKYIKTPVKVDLMDGGPSLVRDAADFNIAFIRTGQKEIAEVKGACDEAANALNQHDELIFAVFASLAKFERLGTDAPIVNRLRDLLAGHKTNAFMEHKEAPWMTQVIMGFEWLLKYVEDDLNMRGVPSGAPSRTTVIALRKLIEE